MFVCCASNTSFALSRWGQNSILGQAAWLPHDACTLLNHGRRVRPLHGCRLYTSISDSSRAGQGATALDCSAEGQSMAGWSPASQRSLTHWHRPPQTLEPWVSPCFPCIPTSSFYGAFCTQSPGEQQRAGLIVRAKHCKPAQPCTSTQNPTDSLRHAEDLLPMYPCQKFLSACCHGSLPLMVLMMSR